MTETKQKTTSLGALPLIAVCILQVAVLPGIQAQTAQDTTSATLFEGARLIVGDGTAPIENSAFIVDHGWFTKIGRKGEIQAPPGTTPVDLTGKTVMPAMIDTHVHAGGATPGLEGKWPSHETYVKFLEMSAYLGISVTQSLGRDTWQGFEVRAESPVDGARLLTCGQGIVGTLGLKPETIAAGTSGRLPEDLGAFEFKASTPEMARDHIKQVASQGVDCVKMWATDRGGLEVMMSPAIYTAIIDEAHRHHIRVYSDSWTLQQFKELVRAGIDGFAHPVRDRDVDDEFVAMLKERPNILMQTNLGYKPVTEAPSWASDPLFLDLTAPEQVKRLSTPQKTSGSISIHEGWPSNSIPYANERYGIIVRNTARLYKAGVAYAVGTDSGGFNYHIQLERLVKDVGLTPSQVITMATRDGAKALSLDRYLGTMELGKEASFVVLDANPLDDIANTRRIADVYLRGHKVDRAGFLESWKEQQHHNNATN